jgi:hypothetical protein
MTDIPVKAALAGGKIIALVVVAVILLVTVGGWLTNPFHWKEKALAKARSALGVAEAQTTIAQGDAAVGRQALDITLHAASADRLTAQTQDQNHDALYSVPTGPAPIDADLAGRWLHGLCRYDALKDGAGCDQLRPLPAGAEQPDAERDAAAD